MSSLLSRFASATLAGSLLGMWLFAGGCAHSTHAASMHGAPTLVNEDGPRAHGGTNPNAPYTMPAAPQLARRHEPSPSTVNPCQSKNLTVTEIAASVNGNYRGVKLAFDNDGLTPCRIGGYPVISLLDQTGTPVANLVVDRVSFSTLRAKLAQGPVSVATEKSDPEITIAPRGEAWFEVGWSTGDGCPVVSRISVSAPGSSESFTVNHPLTVCNGRVQITAIHADQDND